MPYKWIAKEIETLDPYVDYERIWKLTTCYYVDNFLMNYLYSVGVPYFMLPPWGGETLARASKGKMITAPDARADDTSNHFWTWFEFGPSDEKTRRSMKVVNNGHARMEKLMPGSFAHNDDFVYTLAWVACDIHRLRIRVGLPGYTEKQKIATHIFWGEVSKMMLSANGQVFGWPDSFDGILEFMDEYEATDWEHSPDGLRICHELSDQFANRWFPRGFRWVGHKMLLAMWGEPVHRVHHVPHTSAVTRKTFELMIRTVLTVKERVLPDPTTTTPEKNRLKAAAAEERGSKQKVSSVA